MKLSCKIIEDMLPMYYDGICSEESAALIEEHVKNCPHCSHILSALRSDIAVSEAPVDDMKPLKEIQKSYRKMKRHWQIAIAVIVLLVPIAFLVGNRHGEQRGPFIEYTEEEALLCANAFTAALVDGDYAKAFSYWDIEAKKQEWLRGDTFAEEDLVDLEADGLKKFCQMGETIEGIGSFEAFEFVKISGNGYDYRGNKEYGILYRIKFAGKDEAFWVGVTENGIYSMRAADGRIADPLSQFCLWSHWLYDDYLGRYYDYDLKEYVYYGNMD